MTIEQKTIPTRDGRVYFVRTCKKDGTCYSNRAAGFTWPTEIGAEAVAPDWNPDPGIECGSGLHGLAWGEGDWSLLSDDIEALWMVVSALPEDVVISSGGGKHRFRAARVEWVGNWARFFAEAWTTLVSPFSHGLTYDSSTAGNYAHSSTAGYYAHSSTAGYRAHSSTAGNYAHSSTAGEGAHSSTAGYRAHSSTAGEGAHSVCLGREGRARCGKDGFIALTWWDGDRDRIVVGYAGEDGIESGTWYVVRNGRLVKDEDQTP